MSEYLSHPLIQQYRWIAVLIAALLLVRLLYAIIIRMCFRPVNKPGLPRWPRLRSRGVRYLVPISLYLTPWRFVPVRVLSRLGLALARLAFLALLISLIPVAEVQRYFPANSRFVFAGFIVVAVVVHYSRLQRQLGQWLLGKSTDVCFFERHILVLEFIGGLVPFVRWYGRDPGLGLSVVIEPHERAQEETPARPARPLYSDTWHVILRNGNLSIRIATVFGKLDAERVASAFAALRELLEQERGINKRQITDANWRFGQSRSRAE